MKSEINDYKINNADGTSKSAYSEQQISFDNDNPRYIKENPVSAQKETVFVSETFDEPKKGSVRANKDTPKPNDDLSSVSSASSASTAASASSAASAASAVSGGISAIAGTVAASVVSAVIVVAAFVSTLTINLSLLMATMTSLVFKVELSGAQEEDFATPIFAVLEGENDVYREQEIRIDSGYITFDDLEPSTEYIITVKNEEKVFFKKSYFTSGEQTEKGFVSARFENGEVIVSLTDVELKAGEYYTLTAKDDKDNVIFAKDDVEPNKEFTFGLSEPTDLYFALSVSGKTYAVSELKLRTVQYDFNNPVWAWADDFSTATLSFREVHGGESLIVASEITHSEVEPTCETDGRIDYAATAMHGGQTFSDVKSVTLSALGHEYGEPEFIWEQSLTGGYTVTAVRKCTHNAEHVEIMAAEIIRESYIDATCEEDGKTIYYAVVPDTDFSNEKIITESGTALGHNYSVHFEWMQEDNRYTATATYVCSRDESHFGVMDAVVSEQNGTYFAEVQLGGKTYRGAYGDVSLSLNNGNMILYADGYAQNGVFTAFENTENNRYIISGSRTADTPLRFNAKTYSGVSVADGVNYYVDFDNAGIFGTIYATAVVINPYSGVNIYITNKGTSTIKGGNHVAFEAQEGSGHNINIYVTSDNGFTDFVCGRQDGQSPTLYSYNDGTMLFEMNGTAVNAYGNPIQH